MALTQDFIQSLQSGGGGIPANQPITNDQQFENWLKPAPQPQADRIQFPAAPQDFLAQSGRDIVSGIKSELGAAKQDIITPDARSPLSRGISATSHLFSAAAQPITQAPGFKQVGEGINAAIQWAGDKLSNLYSPEFQNQLANMSPEEFTKATEHLQNLSNLGNIAQTLLMAKGGAKSAETIAESSKTAPVTPAAGEPVRPSIPVEKPAAKPIAPEILDKQIVDSYNKGIKPSVAGKGTLGQVEKYNQDIIRGTKAIVQNKDGLSLTDEFGQPTGKLPTNPREFTQAIDQTKKALFQKYDAMAKSAGEKGATVTLEPAVTELNKIAKDKVTNDLNPELAKYAEQRAESLSKSGEYTATEAQDAIQRLNTSLDAFYKNPNYDTASRASVDAMIANQLRTGLDNSISGLEGTGYADLKKQYGSLRAIEKDVNNRAQVQARKTTGGLTFGDVFSAEEVMRGIAHMNPQAFATGVAVKGFTSLWKYLNDPDRHISNMFDSAEKSTSTSGTSPSSTSGQQSQKLQELSPSDTSISKPDSFKSPAVGQTAPTQGGNVGLKTVVGGAIGVEALNQLTKPSVTTYQSPKETPKEPSKVNIEAIRAGLIHSENRGAVSKGADLYKVIGKTGDLGKYQANPQTVKEWSKVWLNKPYTSKEFLNDPQAQENFFNEFSKVVQRLNLTPEEAATAWHKGWGELGIGPKETRDSRFIAKLRTNMQSPENQEYLRQFRIGMQKDQNKMV